MTYAGDNTERGDAEERRITIALRRAWAKDLDAPTLYELLKLRVEVFVVEQASAYPELDGRDLLAETRHFWLETPDREVICTLRLTEEHAGGRKVFRIGRLCTKRSSRGHGHTTRLLRAALADVGDYPCRIDAQIYLANMYAQHGFVREGDDFVDGGVPHVPMLRPGGPPPPQAVARPASSADGPGGPAAPQAVTRPASSADGPGGPAAGTEGAR